MIPEKELQELLGIKANVGIIFYNTLTLTVLEYLETEPSKSKKQGLLASLSKVSTREEATKIIEALPGGDERLIRNKQKCLFFN